MARGRRAFALVPAIVFVMVVVLCSSATSASAEGQAKVELVSVVLMSEGQCPSDERFIGNVRQHTENWRVVDASASTRHFRVVLAPHGAVYRGELLVKTPDGKVSRREIVAPDCERVARGLAIAMAIAIDPRATIGDRTQETGAAPDGSSAAPDADMPSPPPPPTPRADSDPERRPGTDEAQPKQIPKAEAPSARPEPRGRPALALAIEARAELTSGFARDIAAVFGASFEGRIQSARLPEWFAPSLAIGVRQSLPIVVEDASANVEFVWSALAVRLCPVRLAFDRLEIVPCAEANVGLLRAEARGAPGSQRSTSAWFDPGGSVRAVVRVAPSWGVGASVLVSAPVTRHRFGLIGAAPISQAPPVGITGGMLVEHRF